MREQWSQKQVQTQTRKLMLSQTLRQSLEILNYFTQELELFLQYKQQEKSNTNHTNKNTFNCSEQSNQKIPTTLSVFDMLNEELMI